MNDPIDLDRRRILGLTVGLGLGALGGCCTLRPFPSAEIQRPPPGKSSILPILRPSTISSYGKPKGVKYCLDAHTHFFNASDVNVKGFIEGPVAHSIKNDELRVLAEQLSPLVDELAGLAPTSPEEYRDLLAMMGKATAGRSMDGRTLDAIAERKRKEVGQAIIDEMEKRKLKEKFMYLYGKGVSGGRARVKDFDQVIFESLDPLLALPSEAEVSGRSRAIGASQVDPRWLIQFIGNMLSPRWSLLRAYQKVYTEGERSFGIDGAFASLVDFDYFLSCPARSNREDQVKLQSLLSLLSGGYMLPLVGYNPWTDIKRHEASFELVKTAVNEYGFVGVKIYPPIGFFPYGNATLPMSSSKPRPSDLKELDRKLETLFTWCADRGVPVMAHTGESMGRDDASDEYSNPVGWGLLLDRFDGKIAPRINAGHFGGDMPKPGGPGNEWPTEFAKLANRPAGKGFYGDLGYWDTFMECGPTKNGCNTALKRLKSALRENPEMANRIMYGSDWLMFSKVPYWGSYPENLYQAVRDILPAEPLFYQNAINCFGLGKGGRQRDRILSRFQATPAGPPAWLQEL